MKIVFADVKIISFSPKTMDYNYILVGRFDQHCVVVFLLWSFYSSLEVLRS